MTTNALAPHSGTAALLLNGVDKEQQKDQYSRISTFTAWLDKRGASWHTPNLAAYRDWLMGDERMAQDRHSREWKPAAALSASSAAAHLASVRGRYNALLNDNDARQRLYDLVIDQDGSAADRKAFVDETIERLKNDVAPNKSRVKVITEQDVADAKHTRLTLDQANMLLESPLNDRLNTSLQAHRDTALIALMLCTGIREMELCALDVSDLRQTFGGALALHVRKGKGSKARLIPYGGMDWCLIYVDKWLRMAGITEGAVFRGFSNGGQGFRRDSSRLTVRAVQDILNRYPISRAEGVVYVNPHDLRRTYARRLYDAGVDMVAIQQNLGHADSKTTQGYIGTLDADQRKPPSVFRPPHMSRF